MNLNLNLNRVTITTQPYVRDEGERKQMTHTDGMGATRTLFVDIEFDQCDDCRALLLPGEIGRHERWHESLGPGDADD